jgi:serine/threonine protein kinase/tetratricopeptide (TPR) repeat protein
MTISPEHWDRVMEVFSAAQDFGPEAREAFVRQTCADEPDVLREVLRLLRLDTEAEAANFFETPDRGSLLTQERPPLFKEGDLIAERFRVTGLIGQGGMGEVYEARDDYIQNIVALKIARPTQEPLDRVEARWRRELTLSRKVTHSGVCRVHDLARHRSDSGEELLLLTMERVFGDSLADRLRDCRLTLDETLSIATQIGEALDAAHAQEVLHRDVKPDNILIEPREAGGLRAVLTDFGLARPVSDKDAAPVTRSGMFAGTIGYIAPEVLLRQPPTPLSDLYSFAVVVSEMLKVAVAEQPPRLKAIMARATSHEPSARYPSARAFVADSKSVLAPKPLWLSRRHVLRAVPVAVAGVAAYCSFTKAPATPPPGSTTQDDPPPLPISSPVLLTNVTNGTPDRDLDGLTEVLRSQLAQSRQFELVEAARIREVLTLMRLPPDSVLAPEVAREIAMRDGVPLVVFCAVTRAGQDFVFSVKLEHVGNSPSSARRTWDRSFKAQAKRGLFDAVHDAALWIRKSAGEDDDAIRDQDRPPSETTTSSWVALRLLLQADAQAARGNHDAAVLLLEQAIKDDPQFAMAQMRLADSLISLKRDKEGYEAWKRAGDLLEVQQLTSRETLRIRAQYFDDTGDLAKAAKAYRTFTVQYPEDFYAQFFMGSVLMEMDRVGESIQWLKGALATRQSSLPAAVHLASAYLDTGRSVDAGHLVEALSKNEGGEWARWLRALTLFTRRRVDEALRELAPLRTSTDKYWRSRAYTISASWLSETGRDDLALGELGEGITYDSDTGLRDRLADKWLHLATLEERARKPEAAVSARRALQIASNVRRIAIAAGIVARSGDRRGARRIAAALDDYAPVPATETARLYWLGQLFTIEGNTPKALEALESWTARARRPEDRMPLVRAMLASGDKSGAERLLLHIVEHPVAIYARPEPQAPGLWREAVIELERLLAARDAEAAARLRNEYTFIWPESDSQGQSGHN